MAPRRARRPTPGRVSDSPTYGLPVVALVGAGEFVDALSNLFEIFDGRRGAAGHADDPCLRKLLGRRQVAGGLDLNDRFARDLTQPGQLLGVGTVAAADHDHHVHLFCQFHGVLLPPDRDRANSVHHLELVAPADEITGQLLELPRWLGALADQRHSLGTRDALPVLLFVDHDRVGGEAQQANHLRMVGGAQEDDGVALLNQLLELLLLLDDPRAGSVYDLEALRLGAGHDLRRHAMSADNDRRAVVDVVEGVDRSDAVGLQPRDHALVVDDLSQRVRLLALCRGQSRVVDRLAHAVAEAGPPRYADFFNSSHFDFSMAHKRRLRAGARRNATASRVAGRRPAKETMATVAGRLGRNATASRVAPTDWLGRCS